MSARDLVGLSLFTGAAVYGFRAYQQYKAKGGEIQINPAPQPVAPDAYAPSESSFDLSWLGNVFDFDWPSFVPAAQASIPDTFATPAAVPVSRDVLILARTLYGEASGETQAGKEAVANVVMNRTRSRRWPNSVAKVCLQNGRLRSGKVIYQFSCWNTFDPNRARIENLQPGANANFDDCIKIAQRAVSGQLADNTSGATHYHATYIATPYWVEKSPNAFMTRQYGVHKFYKGIA